MLTYNATIDKLQCKISAITKKMADDSCCMPVEESSYVSLTELVLLKKSLINLGPDKEAIETINSYLDEL